MDSGRREQRDPLPDWISHGAVRLHSREPVLHCALRGKPALLAQARDPITEDSGEMDGLFSREARRPLAPALTPPRSEHNRSSFFTAPVPLELYRRVEKRTRVRRAFAA